MAATRFRGPPSTGMVRGVVVPTGKCWSRRRWGREARRRRGLIDALIVRITPDRQLKRRHHGHQPSSDPSRRGWARAPGADCAPACRGLHQPEHPPGVIPGAPPPRRLPDHPRLRAGPRVAVRGRRTLPPSSPPATSRAGAAGADNCEEVAGECGRLDAGALGWADDAAAADVDRGRRRPAPALGSDKGGIGLNRFAVFAESTCRL